MWFDLHVGVSPRNRPDLGEKSTSAMRDKDKRPDALSTYAPDSAMTVLISRAMYCTGVPSGGVARSCMRDFTTSAEGAGEATYPKDRHDGETYPADSMLTSTQSAKAT